MTGRVKVPEKINIRNDRDTEQNEYTGQGAIRLAKFSANKMIDAVSIRLNLKLTNNEDDPIIYNNVLVTNVTHTGSNQIVINFQSGRGDRNVTVTPSDEGTALSITIKNPDGFPRREFKSFCNTQPVQVQNNIRYQIPELIC